MNSDSYEKMTTGGAKAREPEFQWIQLSNGSWQMPDGPAKFLDWLVSFPRVPDSQEKYAAQEGISPRTLRRWKTDKRFIKEWESRAHALNVSTERVQQVIDNLFKIASENAGPAGVKAADLYLQMVDKYTPKKTIVVEDDSLEKLSYADLLSLSGLESAPS